MQRRVSQLLLSSHKGQIHDFDRKSIEITVYSLDHYTTGMKGIFPNRWFLRVADTKTVQNQCKRSYRIAKDLWMITFFMVLVRKSEFGMVAQCVEYIRIRKSTFYLLYRAKPIIMKGNSSNRWYLGAVRAKTVQNECKRSCRIAKDLWMIIFFMVLVSKSKFGMVAKWIEYSRISNSTLYSV